MALIDKLTAIGNAIRNKTGKIGTLTLDQMPQEIESITTGGNYSDKYVEWLKSIADSAGKNYWYNLFWDTYQDYGNRRRYRSTFNCDQADGTQFWTAQTLTPKYSFGKVTMSTFMFYHLHLQVNFMEYFKQYVPDFTFSLEESTDNNFAFCWSFFTHLPVLDLRAAKANNDMILGFAKCLQSVKLIVDKTVTPWMLLKECDALKEIEIEGELCANLDFGKSGQLSKASVIRVMKACSPDSNHSSNNTITFLKGRIDSLFDTSGSYPGNGSESDEWKALVNARPNWKVSLIEN